MDIGQLAQVSTGTFTAPYSGIPVPERLTLQREANDLVELIGKAHAMLDHLTAGPSQVTPAQNAPLLTLGSAISAAKADLNRLTERLDNLLNAVGQI